MNNPIKQWAEQIPKKIYKWKINIWKMPCIICLQGTANLNNIQIPLHTYQNGQIPKHWQHQMLMRMWSNRDCHLLLVGTQNGTATLGDSLAISYKTEHILTIWSSNHASWYWPKGVENLCPHKNLHMDVYSSFIHNRQNLEATKSFIGDR